MKKTNTSVTKITVFFIFLLVLVVGYYAYLSGTHRTEQQEAVMSEVDTALSRDLDNDYPATPKEVIKYYNDLTKCFYNEECTAEELQDLGRKSLQLFDEELQENNDEDTYLIRLQGEVQNYKDNKRKITSVSLAPSTNVDYYSVDGYSFARISCGYTMTENGKKTSTVMVYLLRRDDNRRWKIYGWETADQLNSKLEQTDNN